MIWSAFHKTTVYSAYSQWLSDVFIFYALKGILLQSMDYGNERYKKIIGSEDE
jgi:hypothetical protein